MNQFLGLFVMSCNSNPDLYLIQHHPPLLFQITSVPSIKKCPLSGLTVCCRVFCNGYLNLTHNAQILGKILVQHRQCCDWLSSFAWIIADYLLAKAKRTRKTGFTNFTRNSPPHPFCFLSVDWFISYLDPKQILQQILSTVIIRS